MLQFLLACIHLDPMAMIEAGGYLGISFLVFAESGLFFGVVLPGDSLLFTAGLLAATGILSVVPLIICVVVSAIVGDSTGYWFGAKAGGNLFKREDSRFFKRQYLTRTQRFFETHGGRAVVLARFVPVVRTIAPILAGAGRMRYRRFLPYNVFGGLLWGTGMILFGYFLGTLIPNSEKYVLPLSLAIVFLSLLPLGLNFIRRKRMP
ncbi:MAG: VTT domain-containing protein [Minisyncoccia bacterium]